MSSDSTKLVSADLEAQRAYAEAKVAEGFDFGLTIVEAFVRGIRDLGYKNTGTALDELIDNALQAEARHVDVVFGFRGASSSKPTDVAVIDDGHGMDALMQRLAVIWGGTHRENDRKGFGRYGYGLPSASVSMGRAFSVYAKVDGGTWTRVTVDLDAIEAGEYTVGNKVVVPAPVEAMLPDWISDAVTQRYGDDGPSSGVVVHIERLDRLTWKTAGSLRPHLIEHFGITYRNPLSSDTAVITVDGEQVEPIDPLFLTRGARYYGGDDEVRAEALEGMTIPVADTDTGEVLGEIKVRFAYMPPSFTKNGTSRAGRLAIMKDHNGFVLMREGRQIDVLVRNPWTSILNNDRYWGVEIDFPAVLDEEFSVTTSKQQIRLSDRMWEILREAGVYKTVRHLRDRYVTENAADKREREDGPGPRASEQAMDDADRFKTSPPEPDPERDRRAKQAFDEEVERRQSHSDKPREDLERELQAEIDSHRYVVAEESAPGAPFFRVDQVGGRKVITINKAHRWYTDLYAGPESTPRLRAALEIMLLVLGDCELNAGGDRRLFYEVERQEWSRRMQVVLDRLDHIEAVDEETPPAATQAG